MQQKSQTCTDSYPHCVRACRARLISRTSAQECTGFSMCETSGDCRVADFSFPSPSSQLQIPIYLYVYIQIYLPNYFVKGSSNVSYWYFSPKKHFYRITQCLNVFDWEVIKFSRQPSITQRSSVFSWKHYRDKNSEHYNTVQRIQFVYSRRTFINRGHRCREKQKYGPQMGRKYISSLRCPQIMRCNEGRQFRIQKTFAYLRSHPKGCSY